MAEIRVDTSELNTLAADLTAAGSGIAGKVTPVVHRGANNVKRRMRAEMGASRWFRRAAPSITYDMRGGGRTVFGVGIIEAEIGPQSGPGGVVGDLAALAYFGGSNGGGGTVPDPRGALEAEQPGFERALGDVLDGLL